MTTVGDPVAAADAPTDARPTQRSYRPDRATWPIWGFTAGMPVAYFFGAHGLVFNLPAFVFGARIIADRTTRFPRTTIPLIAFCGWALLSFSQAQFSSVPIFSYRWTLFVGCLAALVWVVNVSEEAVPTRKLVDWLALLWVVMIGFGYLAQVLPDLAMPSPLTVLLGPAGDIDFVARITEWNLSDVQTLLGRDIARPAAPFPAANSWGAAVAILTPFFLRSWIVDARGRRRQTGYALLVAALVPIVLSINRGLWISLIIAAVYFVARKAMRGKFGPIVVLSVAVVAVGVVFVATPVGSVVTDRFDSATESNESRSQLYVDAWEGALDSPLVGNGVPRATNYFESSAPVGTHGLIWYLMFIHGFVGLALFLSWIAIEVFRSGRTRAPLAFWTHLSLVIAFVEMPYYGLLPHVVLIGLAAGIAHREAAMSQRPSRTA